MHIIRISPDDVVIERNIYNEKTLQLGRMKGECHWAGLYLQQIVHQM